MKEKVEIHNLEINSFNSGTEFSSFTFVAYFWEKDGGSNAFYVVFTHSIIKILIVLFSHMYYILWI